jgi:hypothetical protein
MGMGNSECGMRKKKRTEDGNGEFGMRKEKKRTEYGNGEFGMRNAERKKEDRRWECGIRNAECGMRKEIYGMGNAECVIVDMAQGLRRRV